MHHTSPDGLAARCRGRCQRTQPQRRQPEAPLSKPSRQGEVVDLTGWAVAKWFKQLRRLQSLRHAIKTDSPTEQAQEHLHRLWYSIYTAKGFEGAFHRWWPRRPVQHQGAPRQLQGLRLTVEVVETLYTDFQANFRKFESWHIRQRHKVIQKRYESNQHQIYQALTRPRALEVDHLLEMRDYTILAHEQETGLTHLDKDIEGGFHSQSWDVEEEATKVVQAHGDLITLETSTLPTSGQTLTSTRTITDEQELQDNFAGEWRARWNAHLDLPEDVWNRAIAFGIHFLPKGKLEYAEVEMLEWDRALRRLKPTAARGPDGLSKADLQNAPRAHQQQLVSLYGKIEQGLSAWPDQLLQGTVIALAKKPTSQAVLDYRPVTIYGIPYRLWSSVRARTALRHVEQYCNFGMYGFLPGREAAQYYYEQQAEVEVHLQTGAGLAGWCSDLKKCFNTLGRHPIMRLGLHLGLPGPWLHAWQMFLDRNQRRFQIRGGLGEPISSVNGMPEGCGLSTVAMCLVDLSFHAFFKAFQPEVMSFSFVDNFAVLADTAAALYRAWIAFLSFCEMWRVEPDADKTLAWAINKPDVALLHGTDLRVVTDMKDLGAYYTFSHRRAHKKIVQGKSADLHSEWSKLRRVAAPYHQKLEALFVKFWPSVFYGTAICSVTEAEIMHLRTTASRAIHAHRAGSNPLLRLSLSANILADPGFFRTWAVLQDLRRLCRKSPQLVTLWRRFHENLYCTRAAAAGTILSDHADFRPAWMAHGGPTMDPGPHEYAHEPAAGQPDGAASTSSGWVATLRIQQGAITEDDGRPTGHRPASYQVGQRQALSAGDLASSSATGWKFSIGGAARQV